VSDVAGATRIDPGVAQCGDGRTILGRSFYVGAVTGWLIFEPWQDPIPPGRHGIGGAVPSAALGNRFNGRAL
jgi:hypothetical protein